MKKYSILLIMLALLQPNFIQTMKSANVTQSPVELNNFSQELGFLENLPSELQEHLFLCLFEKVNFEDPIAATQALSDYKNLYLINKNIHSVMMNSSKLSHYLPVCPFIEKKNSVSLQKILLKLTKQGNHKILNNFLNILTIDYESHGIIIYISSRFRHHKFTRRLLEEGLLENVQNQSLIRAILIHDHSTVAHLIKRNQHHAQLADRNNALTIAACVGNYEAIKLLLPYHQDEINTKNNKGLSPLLLAIGYHELSIVKLLLEKGTYTNEDLIEFLEKAIEIKSTQCMILLLDKNPSIDHILDFIQKNNLMKNHLIFKFFISHAHTQCLLNSENEMLVLSVIDFLKLVKKHKKLFWCFFIAFASNKEYYSTFEGGPVIHINCNCVDMLKKKLLALDFSDYLSPQTILKTLLTNVQDQSNTEYLAFFIEHNLIPIDIINSEGKTLLMVYAELKSVNVLTVAIVMYLLKQGANIHSKDPQGKSALNYLQNFLQKITPESFVNAEEAKQNCSKILEKRLEKDIQ